MDYMKTKCRDCKYLKFQLNANSLNNGFIVIFNENYYCSKNYTYDSCEYGGKMDILELKWKTLIRPLELNFSNGKTLLEIFPEFKYENIKLLEDRSNDKYSEYIILVSDEEIVVKGIVE